MHPGSIRIEKNKIIVEAAPHVAIKLRRVFGGVQRKRAGSFTLTATPAQAHELAWFRDRYPLDIEPESLAQFTELVAIHDRRAEAIAELDREGYIPREFELAVPAREYQRFAADMAIRTGGLLVGDDVGLGKTATAICTFTAPTVLPVLVVTMTHLTRQWEAQIAKFAPSLRVHRIRKAQSYKFHDIKMEKDVTTGKRRIIRGTQMPDVIVTSYSKIHGWVEELASVVKTVVFDEIQELRHPDSRKYKSAIAIADACDLKMGLSATPIYNYGGEIHAVMRPLSKDALGSWDEFRDEWCGGSRDEDRKIKVEDPVALGHYLRASGIFIRRTRKDVGRELPPLSIIRHVVEADPDRINAAMDDVAELARRILDRIGSNLDLMKASGELDYRMRQATGIAKAGEVAEFVRVLIEAGEKVVLYGWHRAVYDLWKANFDKVGAAIRYVMYTGEESEAQKDAARKRFIEGDADLIIISLRSGAGLDGLQFVSRTVVFGELDWSPKVHEQDIGRVYRDGQPEPVTAYYLEAETGSDPIIIDTLGLKESQSTGIVDPDAPEDAVFQSADPNHIRKLAESILQRRKVPSV